MSTVDAAGGMEARLADALTGAAPLKPLLLPAVRFQSLNRSAEGADAVAAELEAGAYRRLTWQRRRAEAGDFSLVGVPADGSSDRVIFLTIGLQDGAIARVQHQLGPSPLRTPTRLVIPEAVKAMVNKSLAERHPMVVAHTDSEGQPVLSYRGSVQVFGDDQLALWIRNPAGGFIRSLRHNPRVALMYRNEETRATYQFRGRARVSDSQDDRQRIYEAMPAVEQHHDFARTGVAVVIDLDRLEGWAGIANGPIDPIDMRRSS